MVLAMQFNVYSFLILKEKLNEFSVNNRRRNSFKSSN